MKAWLLDSLSGLDALHCGEAPDPQPAAGQAVLAVQFAALNPADRYLAEGAYPARPTFPHILGRDGLGTVIAAPDSPGLVGKKQIILRGVVGVSAPGTFAQKVSVPIENLVDVPSGWSDEQAAGAPLTYLTAYQALTMWDDLPEKSTVLITGASGGVGVATVQLAKAAGHGVIALSRDPGKQSRLRKLGADITLSPDQPNWREQLKSRRVDLAIDNIGGPGLMEVIAAMNERGRISCVGRLSGPVPQFNTAALFFRRLRLGGVAVGAYTAPESRAAWGAILDRLARTGAQPVVDSVHGFSELKAAFARLSAGPMGKVLLDVGNG